MYITKQTNIKKRIIKTTTTTKPATYTVGVDDLFRLGFYQDPYCVTRKSESWNNKSQY